MLPKKMTNLEKAKRKLKREKKLRKSENRLTEFFPEFRLFFGW